MKILHINQSDLAGGGAIAAYRLHQGLRKQGLASKLLVGQVTQSDPLVALTPIIPFRKKLKNLADILGLNYVTQWGTQAINQHPFYQEADILNFHNLHGGYFNYLFIPQLTRHKPTIYTLHDMWSFTGHCSYSFGCQRWQKGCGKCPYPNTYPAIKRDSTALEWKLKNWVYHQTHLTIVTPSQWLMNQVKLSMLNHLDICHIPNGVNLDIYHPLDQQICRYFLGISHKKYVLLTSSINFHDPRKGSDLLIQALNLLPNAIRKETILLAMGVAGNVLEKAVDMAVYSLGYIHLDQLKAGVFAAADVFVLPTRADNLPLVLQEAMACGTPLVSFAVGGVPELVRPGVTGRLAEPENPQSLAHQIEQILVNREYRQQMAQKCREIARQEYDLSQQVQHYKQLYQQVQNPLPPKLQSDTAIAIPPD
ncbi:glycosyl transferase, group 1 [Gloeomargarita lithophora Alchichica-D10]|uniref:Glycosyl transferase, group 1 n=1 Tax=Gloeomargarita lithophora Alchichica-D10 TaxID=1188229 RepID=A0A1J0ACM5_9CYAN|nr:glycosyltransferase family 4 protein [Gloeomargarita lithophora]APB33671.1 glycosyl transferase, group 1 [Gloeomargarita lithophora Alchichica-D10]